MKPRSCCWPRSGPDCVICKRSDWATSRWTARAGRCRGVKCNASISPLPWGHRSRTRYSYSMNRRSACIRAICSASSASCDACAMPVIHWLWSSMIRRSCLPPTMSSILGPGPVKQGGASSTRAPRAVWPKRRRSRAIGSADVGGSLPAPDRPARQVPDQIQAKRPPRMPQPTPLVRSRCIPVVGVRSNQARRNLFWKGPEPTTCATSAWKFRSSAWWCSPVYRAPANPR